MESISSTIKMLFKHCFMVVVDLKDAYYHVPIHEIYQRFLRVAGHQVKVLSDNQVAVAYVNHQVWNTLRVPDGSSEPPAPDSRKSDQPSTSEGTPFDGMVFERSLLKNRGFSPNLIDTLMKSRKHITTKIYSRTWRKFLASSNFNIEEGIPINQILEFLQKGLELNLSTSTLKISIENDYLGPRRIESLKKEDADWQKKAHMAVLSIQDLTVKYFEITAKAQKAVFDRMRADQKKFGKTSWTAAVERMEKLQYGVSKETLQLMRAKEICLEQKKHALKEEMQSLHGGTEALAVLDQLEADYYGHQLQLYEVQFEILKCEELLLTAQLESIKRQISEKREEVVYYDAYESMDAMPATEDMALSIHLQREEFHKLQLKVRQLEAKRGRISAKKAYLRNKKV
ncbi:unnamed protein product [Ranitomeya imitator]|uniref:JMY/WHAMM middle domain-containing protein n=1 Tax=Ranitomeya imitator TaxID=111125 RepID=A0ABN9LJB2_9NEOB|nr:unnamed protein product [Ranitomeya imitator]